MSNTRLPFTPEQKVILAANPFTLSVNDYTIRFTKQFKEFLLAEHERNKTPWKDVFRKAGYDPEVLGKKTDGKHHIPYQKRSKVSRRSARDFS